MVTGLAALSGASLVYFILLRKCQRTIIFSFVDSESSNSAASWMNREAIRRARHFSSRGPVPWRLIFRHIAFWSLLIAEYTHRNATNIVVSWLPTYFHDTFSGARSLVFNVVPWLPTILCSLFSRRLADQLLHCGCVVTFVRKLMASVALVGTAIFLLLMSYVHSCTGVLLCMTLALVCSCFHNSSIALNPQDLAPKFGGVIFGLMNMVGAVTGFVGVYVAGCILEATKSWSFVFNQTAGICIFGWLVYIFFWYRHQLV